MFMGFWCRKTSFCGFWGSLNSYLIFILLNKAFYLNFYYESHNAYFYVFQKCDSFPGTVCILRILTNINMPLVDKQNLIFEFCDLGPQKPHKNMSYDPKRIFIST